MKKVFKIKTKENNNFTVKLVKDSIMQEYNEFKRNLGTEKAKALDKYLNKHKELSYSDIIYKKVEFDKFNEWFIRGMKDASFAVQTKNEAIDKLSKWNYNDNFDLILPGGKFARIVVNKEKTPITYTAWTSKLEKREFTKPQQASNYIGLIGFDKLFKDSKMKDTWKFVENYKNVEIYKDDDTGNYGFIHNKGKRLYNTNKKNIEQAKKIIEKDLEFLGKDSKMKDYQSYVGYAGAEKLKQDIKNHNGNPAVFSYFLKPKEPSAIQLMGAIINKQDYFLTMVMKNVTYKGDLNGAKKDALNAVDDVVKTWKSLSYEDSKTVKDSKPEFEAKGKWVWDDVVQDWYDTGAKMYYTELRKLNGFVDNSVRDGGLSSSDIIIIEDAIFDVKRSGKKATINEVLKQLEINMKGFLGKNKNDVIKYLKTIGIKDSNIRDYKANVYKSSSYKIEEKLPNGYGVAKTYGDGLFYVFDKNGDIIDYPSYAFRNNAVEAAKKYKDCKTYKVTHKDKTYKVVAKDKKEAVLKVLNECR